jgi:serine/threonine protein phosphatase PrpC
VTDGRETVQELSLRKGEALILLSDGASGEDCLRAALEGTEPAPGEMAARILEYSRGAETDDATVAVVRLRTLPSST